MSPERTRPDPSVHWDDVYTRLTDTEVSWYEASPESSLALLDAAGATPEMAVVDIGAGASRLVDALLARGFSDVTALDVSDGGLARSRERLGPDAGRVRWEVADLLAGSLTGGSESGTTGLFSTSWSIPATGRGIAHC